MLWAELEGGLKRDFSKRLFPANLLCINQWLLWTVALCCWLETKTNDYRVDQTKFSTLKPVSVHFFLTFISANILNSEDNL